MPMSIPEPHLTLTRTLATRYAALPQVHAVFLGGSLATGSAAPDSDIDLYVCVTFDLSPHERASIVSPTTDPAAIRNDYWGPGDEWIDAATGIHVDVIFWNTGWLADQVKRVLVRHEAWIGYTTSFWFTVRHAHPLYDRDGWLAALLAQARQPYPEPLVRNIIANNYPILRSTPSSFLHQIAKAIARRDLVSINHRVAALLASVFDILFAVNRLPHPGEKRLLDHAEQHCAKLPVTFRTDVETLIRSLAEADASLLSHVNLLLDHLDALLAAEGLIEPR